MDILGRQTLHNADTIRLCREDVLFFVAVEFNALDCYFWKHVCLCLLYYLAVMTMQWQKKTKKKKKENQSEDKEQEVFPPRQCWRHSEALRQWC